MAASLKMSSSCQDCFQKVKGQVESIKMILRCAICCSTLRDPVMTTCNHAFCRLCLFECFKKLSTMRCPICNSTLNKRSCSGCPLLSSVVQKYLLLAKVFKKDLLATDFAKENDFIESQIAMTQASSISSANPLLLLRTRLEAVCAAGQPNNNRTASKSVKRRLDKPCGKGKIPRVDEETAQINVAANSDVDKCSTSPGTVDAACNTDQNFSSAISTADVGCNTESKNLSEEVSFFGKVDGLKQMGDIGIQTELEIQSKGLTTNYVNVAVSGTHAKMEDFNVRGELATLPQIQRSNKTNYADLLAQMEADVNATLEGKKERSRIEVLLAHMPWIPNFLCMTRKGLVSAVNDKKTEEELSNEPTSSKNDIDLVPESNQEVEMVNTPDISCAFDPLLINVQRSQNRHVSLAENATVSSVKSERATENTKISHFLMVSGASKLAHQALLREFLDSFGSFQFLESTSRRCTHLVVFTANGLVCEYWTVKFIYALVNHCTIVSHSWLSECLRQRTVVATENFEVSLKIDNSLVNITTQRALVDPCTLFSSHIFYVPQTFFHTPLVARDVFLEIIEMSGGKVVKHVWELSDGQSYIIFAPDCLNRDAARRFELDVKKEVLTADWIFASIGQHRILDRDPYRVVHFVD